MIQETLERDAPCTVSLALDDWSAYHHGYTYVHLGNIFILISYIWRLNISFSPVYITNTWRRQQLTLCRGPYDEKHSSENLVTWLLVSFIIDVIFIVTPG